MYYGRQNSTNSDYYNTYNSSSYQYNNSKDYLILILKILLIALLIGLLFVGYLFIVNETKFASTVNNKSHQFKIYEDMSLPKTKVEVKKIKRGGGSMSQEDMAQVVQLVISKLNQKKREKIVDDEYYTKELLSQTVDGLTNSSQDIDFDNLDTKQIVKQKKIGLKDIDYYNKVVINQPKDETYTNDRLAQLSSELSLAVDDELSDIGSSSYTEEITKEIAVRSNEMRTIVVQQGDTLSKIAYRAYGDYDSYVKIFEANPEVIINPDQIFVGQRLRIPL
jgi:LysM repeat protein